MTIKLHDLKPAPGLKTARTRVGRGEGSKGKTAGRGTKGTKARKNVPATFEGGQMPLHMRADAVVLDLHHCVAILPENADARIFGVGVLRHVRQRLGDDEVGDGLHRRRHPPLGDLVDLDRHGRAAGQRLERRRRRPRSVRIAGWMPRASSRSSSSALASSSRAPSRIRSATSGSVRSLVLARPSCSDSADEPLLRAVVQVALQRAALGHADLDDLAPARPAARRRAPCSSASRRSFSSASAAAAPAARTRPGSSSSAASWTIARHRHRPRARSR